ARDCAPDAERDVDRHQQRFVGEGIEQRTELAGHIESLGEEAIDRVADAGNDEDREGQFHLLGGDRPDHDGHKQDPAKRDAVRNGVWNSRPAFPGYRFDSTANPALYWPSRLLST